MILNDLRKNYHKNICEKLLSIDEKGIPNNADKHITISVELAKGIIKELNIEIKEKIKGSGQTAGKSFETITLDFIKKTFFYLNHLRPGNFNFSVGTSIHAFEQYEHLELLTKILKNNKELKATLGDYLIHPDIVISREPLDDKDINEKNKLVSKDRAVFTPLRKRNSAKSILHASISCKWTIRSDRSQNSRTEGLNLIRNRKGNTPHIAIVTAEPYPQRIASLALGTGDIDCVYHFALHELIKATNELNNETVTEILDTLVIGKRLRDISDLPFDLSI